MCVCVFHSFSPFSAVGYEAITFNYTVEDLLKCDKHKKEKNNPEEVQGSV